MNEPTNVASFPCPATHTSRMQILQFEQSSYILTSQTKPSFPCSRSNCCARCQCHHWLPAERDSISPFYQVRFCVRRGRGCAHTSPQRDNVQNQRLPRSSGTSSLCSAVLKTHSHSFSTEKSALFIVLQTPCLLTDNPTCQKVSHQEWEGWII